MIKALKKLEIEGIFLHIIKVIYDKSRANIILHGEQLKPFPLKSGNETVLSAFSTPIQYSFEIPSQSNKTRAKNKRDSKREGRSPTTICR
jgi:hypothetical protein